MDNQTKTRTELLTQNPNDPTLLPLVDIITLDKILMEEVRLSGAT